MMHRFMAAALKTLFNRPGGSGRGAAFTFGLRIASTGLTFATSFVLARFLGLAGYSTYALALEWLTFLTVPAALGMDRFMVREVAVYRARAQWPELRGFLRWGNLAVLAASLAAAGSGALLVTVFVSDRDGLRLSLYLALAALPLTSLTTLRQAAMRGFDRIVGGQWPELILRPLLILALSTLGWLLLPEFSAPWAVAALALGTVAAFLVGAALLSRVLQGAPPAQPVYRSRAWLGTALPFMLISATYVLNNKVGVLLLGPLGEPTDVGLYQVASRGADLIALVLLAVNTAFAPTLARLYAQEKPRQLEHAVARSTRLITLVSLPVALGFIAFGGFFLAIFGPEFTAARGTLTILCAGQLVNAATGTVATLLNMTGHERDTALVVGFSAAVNVSLNLLLIPRYGLNGAAAATALGTLVWNALLSYFVYRRLGFYSVLGVYTLRKRG